MSLDKDYPYLDMYHVIRNLFYAAAGLLACSFVLAAAQGVPEARPEGGTEPRGQALLDSAKTLNMKGDFAVAEKLYEECLETTEGAYGTSHPSVVEASIGLGICLGNLGDYEGANAVLRSRLDAVIENNGEHCAEAGNLMLNLAEALDMLGHQAESTRLYRRAAVIIEEIYGFEHARFAAALSGLAHIQRRMGNSPEAETLYRRCIAIIERNHGSPHPDLIHYRSRLGMCLFERQRFDQGIASIERAISEASGIYGADSYQVALEKRHLGLILEYINREEEAYAVLLGSLTTLESYFGPGHPYLSKCLKGLASVSFKLNAPDEALTYIVRAVSLHKNTAGRDQYELSLLLSQQSVFEMYLGKWDDAVINSRRATETSLTVLDQIYQVASAREALLYAVRASACLSNLVTAMAAHPTLPDSTLMQVFSLVVRTHGQVLDRMAERQRFLELSSDTTMVAKAQGDFAAAAQRVSDLAVRGPGNDRKGYREKLTRARREQEEAERALSAAGERTRLLVQLPGMVRDISPELLAGALPPGATLIHFVRFSKWIGNGQQPGDPRLPYYGAFRLQKTKTGSWDLCFLELGDAAELDSLVFAYRSTIDQVDSGRRPSAREEAEFRSVARRLYDRIWMPLKIQPDETAAPTDDSVKMVFLVLDSWLNVLDFNTFIAPNGELVIERWKLHLLSSARDLLRTKRVIPRGTGLLAVGNPATTSVGPQEKDRHELAVSRSSSVLCADTQRAPVSLPGAEKETRSIAGLFSAATGETVTTLVGVDGTEEAVKSSIAGKRVVHLATHGFFCEEDQKNTVPSAERLVDPLLMSGLVLAAGSGEDDGLLTAQEVIGLDLRDLDWVVLSACGSGLGRLFWGEGMFGLSRAFELSGARTVITALWRINDAVTQELMERIYHLRFTGSSTVDAVRRAQLERLRDQRRRLNRVHPTLWGGIVAQGDWR